MAKMTPQDFVMDLGSGDGRTVIAAAKRGARAMGIEYNPDMVELSKQNAAAGRRRGKATFVKADLFETDFSKATVITMFLLPRHQPEVAAEDPQPEARHAHRVEHLHHGRVEARPDRARRGDCTSWCTALLWIVPAKVDGTWTLAEGELTLKQKFQMLIGTLGDDADRERQLRGDAISFTANGTAYTGR